MQLTQSSKFNKNYAAKIVEIENFINHPNPKCERLKCCTIDGYSVAVSININPGIYIYFPIECVINEKFLSANNLFKDKVKNVDKGQTGFFENNCRVKIVKLQGYPSEGFIAPIVYLYNWLTLIGKKNDIVHKVIPGTEFDSIDGELLCRKYVPEHIHTSSQLKAGNKATKGLKKVKKIINTQFRFHYNTTLIKKCPSAIHPNDIISITAKVHGTSGISAYVLCKQKLTWIQKITKWLTKENTAKYDYLWSSRSVVKNPYCDETVNNNFYKVDIWKYADDVVRPHLQKGMTAYYEIIGYLPNGAAIQKLGGRAFDYGFESPKSIKKYKYGENFGIQVYRVTYTNPDGHVYEFNARQVQQWCIKEGLKPVEEYYYGYAKDLYPELPLTEYWNENFIQKLASDRNFFMECESPTCNNKVPHEGVVIKIENFLSEAYKLKCIKFLEGESKLLDNGEVDIETES